jgi:hypothetical protein
MNFPSYNEFWELCKLDSDETHSWEYRFQKLSLALWLIADRHCYLNDNDNRESIEEKFKEYLKEAKEVLSK